MDLADKLREYFAVQEKNQGLPVQGQDSISKQLERLRAIQEGKRSGPGLQRSEVEHQDLEGEILSNSDGSFLYSCKKVCCPGEEERSFVSSSLAGLTSLLELLYGKRLDLVPNQIFFLDTETTGLSGGTGTYAFLVGIGHWEKQEFLVEQYFMRDYHEEGAMLRALGDHLSQAQYVITFNGKTFDLPILESRFVLSRLHWPLNSGSHLDILHPARRIWRLRLRDCSLSNLEREILGVYRENDVPGQLIPMLYFNYIRTGVPRGIRGVLEHNRQDIASLAALAQRVSRLLTGLSEVTAQPGEDLLSAGKYCRDLGQRQKSLEFNRAALETGLTGELRLQAMDRLAASFKSEGLHSQAVALWEQALRESVVFREESGRNLAIHYEHRERDFAKALELTERALEGLVQMDCRTQISEWIYRRKRLLRKTGSEAGALTVEESS
ncbi:MAG TPA: ribonuclease H-like domain-containing protein [Terriglobia bacterium]|nr:ribonuclease H-like domain-containing protein [Terriglobia bacterium]